MSLLKSWNTVFSIGFAAGATGRRRLRALRLRRSCPGCADHRPLSIPSEGIRQTAEREGVAEIKKRFPVQWRQWLSQSRQSGR